LKYLVVSVDSNDNEFMYISISYFHEPRWLSRYSDCLRDGRQRGRSSISGEVKNFHFSIPSKPALGPPSLLYNG
jgi:hypothetical protein